jgi:hypothetical protein
MKKEEREKKKKNEERGTKKETWEVNGKNKCQIGKNEGKKGTIGVKK